MYRGSFFRFRKNLMSKIIEKTICLKNLEREGSLIILQISKLFLDQFLDAIWISVPRGRKNGLFRWVLRIKKSGLKFSPLFCQHNLILSEFFRRSLDFFLLDLTPKIWTPRFFCLFPHP